jgi:hypothetical protein
MTLYDVFLWLNETAVGVAIRDSLWLFPAIQVVHLLALAVLGGAVLAVDLRVLGIALKGVSVEALSRDLARVMTGSLIVITLSGIGMFLSEALRMYDNAAFWAKLGAFVIAVAFTYGVRPRWLTDAASRQAPARAIAGVSIGLWTLVAAAGRGIGFW